MILDHTLKISSKEWDKVNQPLSSDKTAFRFFEQKKKDKLKELLLSRMNDKNTHHYETPDEVKEWLDDDDQW